MRTSSRPFITFRVTSALALAALASAASAQAPAPTPAPQAPPPAAPGAGPLAGIAVSGVIEANYTVNFNQPYNGSNSYLYNTSEGQFSLNLADVRLSKPATPTSRAGFFIRPVAGEVARRNFHTGDHPATPDLAILEAYGTFLVPARGRDLKVDVGQFVTHVGYETIDIGTNNFFSRNFLFQIPSPFYNAGVRASIPLSARTTATGFILNRYNGTADGGNRDLAPGFQIVQTFSPTSNLVFNGLTSRENLSGTGGWTPGYPGSAPGTGQTFQDSVNRQQSVLDLIYSNQFSPASKIVIEGLYRFGKDGNKRDYSIYGATGYYIHTFRNANVAALRAEFLGQNKKNSELSLVPVLPVDSTDKKPTLGSVTASYELKAGIFPGVRTLLEGRLDFANTKVFPGKEPGKEKKSQATFTIGQVYGF